MTETLTDAFIAEQKRVRELLWRYKELGSAGAFGTVMIKQVLQRAGKAAIEGDSVAILAAYNELKDCD